MSGLDKNRVRNQTISFRVSPEEKKQLKARILVTGMPSGRYFIESVLHQKICIAVGKYQSDRLSIEIKKIREQMAEIGENTEELQLLVMDCIYLIEQLIELITTDATGELISGDFRTAQQKDEMSKDIKNAPAGNRDIEE